MDPQQCGHSPDDGSSSLDLLSLFCGPESSLRSSHSLEGSRQASDDKLCGQHDIFPILPDGSLDGSDLDPEHGNPDYRAEWERRNSVDFTQAAQYAYCTPSPDSLNSFLVSHDHYDTSTPTCSSLSTELEERTPSNSGAAGSLIAKTRSQLGPQNRSRARAKFTHDEDQLIVRLRNKRETWKEIAKKIPGRSPGALQVRYSTKLKFSSVDWENGRDRQIEQALRKYEQQKWVFVASQIGTGVSPEACRDRALSQLGLSVVRFRRVRE